MCCNEFKNRSLLLPASDIKAQHIGIFILMRILDIIEKIFPSICIDVLILFTLPSRRAHTRAQKKKMSLLRIEPMTN